MTNKIVNTYTNSMNRSSKFRVRGPPTSTVTDERVNAPRRADRTHQPTTN
jgi:hypothetical protein